MKIGMMMAALGLLNGGAVYAQRDTGQYGQPAQSPENQARMALFGSSFCATRQASATASKILMTGIGSAEEGKLVKLLRTVAQQCYQPQWPAFPQTDVRNALAEIEYREHYKTVPAATPPGTSPPASFAVAKSGETGTPQQEASWYLGALANCIVFVDAPTAHNLVVGPRGVDEEGTRFEKLKPAVAQCSPASGVPGMNARAIRGYLADALLDRAQRAGLKK